MSKCGAGEKQKGDPYMRSQTFFMKNMAVKNFNSQLRDSQCRQSTDLSQPKRRVPKFYRLTQTENVQRRSMNTFSEKLFT